ncbi:MAG TPA: hypothetical protein VGZ26_07185, partial [Pirellulales bacterium]|nr:hypothetical protein [Pirellulales bacterium]
GLETILAIMQIVDQTLSRLRYSTQARTLAEMALVRIANLDNLDELADLIAQLRDGMPHEESISRTATGRSAATREINSPSAAKKKADLNTARETGSDAPAQPATPRRPFAVETVSAIWQDVLADFGGLVEENASRCQSVAFCVPNRLVVSFQAKYTSCKAFCERPDQVAKLEAALAKATGTKVKIDFVLLEDDKPAGPAVRRPLDYRQRLAEKAEHPLVRRATELFDAQLLRIEEPGN